MNISRGDPDEIQVNVRVEPISTFKADNGGCVDIITGEAIDNIIITFHIQPLHSDLLLPLKYIPTLILWFIMLLFIKVQV